jgi:hypothetical protein
MTFLSVTRIASHNIQNTPQFQSSWRGRSWIPSAVAALVPSLVPLTVRSLEAPAGLTTDFIDYFPSRKCAKAFIEICCQGDSRTGTGDLIAAHIATFCSFGSDFIQLITFFSSVF